MMTNGRDVNDVGQALRSKREMLGLSARALSAELGKSPTYISKVEAGDINLTLAGFCEIARRLELTNLEILWLMQLELRTAHERVEDVA